MVSSNNGKQLRMSAAEFQQFMASQGKSPKSKYRNKKVKTEEGTFDSVEEYNRWCELKMLARAGEISELRSQVPFELIPATQSERAVIYKADFVYIDKNGKEVVEDSKGCYTKEYKIKRKLMALQGHPITETGRAIENRKLKKGT